MERTLRNNRQVLETLTRLLRGNPDGVVPVVGAGLSIPSGYPGWRGFIEQVLQEFILAGHLNDADVNAVQQDLAENDLRQAAAVLRTRNPRAFASSLKYRFGTASRSISGAVAKLPDLFSRLMLTTNYDRVIETVWRSHLHQAEGPAAELEVLLPNSAADLDRALVDVGHFLLKVHGDVKVEESWVLTDEQYDRYYYAPSAPLKLFFERLWTSRMPLFLGASLEDRTLLDLLRVSGRQAFAVMPFQGAEEQRRMTRRNGNRIHIIWLYPEVETGNPSDCFEVLEPLLDRLARKSRLGRGVGPIVVPRTSTEWRDTAITEAEATGDYELGLKILESQPAAMAEHLRVTQIMRLADLGDSAERGLAALTRYLNSGDREPHPDPTALNYYKARLLGKQGQFSAALNQHLENATEGGLGDEFQVRSFFERGQLLFRLEEFERANEVFLDLNAAADELEHVDHLRLDVLKFAASLKCLNLIADVPCAEVIRPASLPSHPDAALEIAVQARDEADSKGYPDGSAWASAIAALAYEALGQRRKGMVEFKRSLQICQIGRCRKSSFTHIRRYYAGFLRRGGKLDEAEAALSDWGDDRSRTPALKSDPKTFEELYLIRSKRHDLEGAANALEMALVLYDSEPTIRKVGLYGLGRRLLKLNALYENLRSALK